MDDSTKYAFCIEMARKAEENGHLHAMDAWYKRAWQLLNSTSEDAEWKTYYNVAS